jgi:hypothetical protein
MKWLGRGRLHWVLTMSSTIGLLLIVDPEGRQIVELVE